jgi:hypothetical protein
MRVTDIREGEVYARDESYPFVRLILLVMEDGMVRYEEYDRYTGERFTTDRYCSAHAFARWATASLPEADKRRLKVAEAQVEDRRQSASLSVALRKAVLQGATDNELAGELRRRGFVVRLERRR